MIILIQPNNNQTTMPAFVFAGIAVVMFLGPRIYLLAKSNRRYVDPVNHFQIVNFFTWLAAVFGLAAIIIFVIGHAYNLP